MVSHPAEPEKTDANFDTVDADLNTKANRPAEMIVAEAETEKGLEVESWMTNENLFSPKADFTLVETESGLTVDAWMTSSFYFIGNSFDAAPDTEPSLEIENWMLQDEFFTSAELVIDEESRLQVEDWMLDTKNFEKSGESLELEAWMTDNNIWF